MYRTFLIFARNVLSPRKLAATEIKVVIVACNIYKHVIYATTYCETDLITTVIIYVLHYPLQSRRLDVID